MTNGRQEQAAVKYRTIVVDPPWAFNQAWHKGNDFLAYSKVDGKTNLAAAANAGVRSLNGAHYKRGAAANYTVLSLNEIAAIPIGEWADETAHIYVWTTNSFMREAHDLLEAWGFKQKTILTWIKPRLGMGTYYRNCTEHVVFGTKGKRARLLRRDLRTYFYGEQGRHSEKPASFYDLVEQASPGPYLDVFARKHRFNWDVYGNEVYSDIPLVGVE